MPDYDLFVIGAGSGGLAAAKNAAKYGKKVAIAEYSKVGGTCVIRGCIPKKIMSYAGNIADTLEDAKGYGFTIKDYSFNFKNFIKKRNDEIDRLNNVHISLLEKSGVELITGKAKLKDKNTITVNDKEYTAKTIILATGGTPSKINIEGSKHLITSDQLWQIETLPKTMVIWGGGYIALEFASIFAALGTKIDIIIRREHVLRGFDMDIRKHLQAELKKRDICIHKNTSIDKVTINKNSTKDIYLNNGDKLQAEYVLCATGRTPLTKDIGLEENNIKLNQKGEVIVNNKLQTSHDNIYAIGDMIGLVNLTPVAIKHGRMVTDNLYNNSNKTVSDEAPSAVFTTPPIGTVGLSEEEAKNQLGEENVTVYKEGFRPMLHVLSMRDERSFMKMIVNKKTNVVLGLHMVGRDAPEIIQGFAVAVKAKLTKQQFDETVAIHPSSAEEFVLMK